MRLQNQITLSAYFAKRPQGQEAAAWGALVRASNTLLPLKNVLRTARYTFTKAFNTRAALYYTLLRAKNTLTAAWYTLLRQTTTLPGAWYTFIEAWYTMRTEGDTLLPAKNTLPVAKHTLPDAKNGKIAFSYYFTRHINTLINRCLYTDNSPPLFADSRFAFQPLKLSRPFLNYSTYKSKNYGK